MLDHSNTSNDDAFYNINFCIFNDVHVISTFDNVIETCNFNFFIIKHFSRSINVFRIIDVFVFYFNIIKIDNSDYFNKGGYNNC